MESITREREREQRQRTQTSELAEKQGLDELKKDKTV